MSDAQFLAIFFMLMAIFGMLVSINIHLGRRR
jgi:hypothetical protein